ncbi:MAG: hypothetical protein HY302_03990 [Opitutae bacterium]|nr:hypothetical protein [Opitutae bacterium]
MNTKNCRRQLALAWVTLALATMGTPASAGDQTPREKPPRIKKADADKDGVVSDAEKAAAKAERDRKKADFDAKMLERYDADKNGALDANERAKMIADRKAEREKEKAQKEPRQAEKAGPKAAKDRAADQPK